MEFVYTAVKNFEKRLTFVEVMNSEQMFSGEIGMPFYLYPYKQKAEIQLSHLTQIVNYHNYNYQ